MAATLIAAAGGAAPALTVDVTMPPVSIESSEESMRDMGRLGSHIIGHYWTLSTTHYVWYSHDGSGFDPGTFDAGLSVLTGIEVALAAGNRTAAQVATATASAITTEGTFTATALVAVVTVTGTATAAGGTRTWDAANTGTDFGIAGMQAADLAGLNNFANAATSAALLDAAEIPAEDLIITGFRMTVGDTHSTQCTVAIYQGGASDTDFNTATLVGVVGVTTGTATLTNVYVPCPTPFLLDPTAGRIWVLWSHAVGGFTAPYPFNSETNAIHVAARDTSNWVVAASNTTREINTIALTSDPADWPATLGAVTSQTVGMPPISLAFVTAAGFQNDMRVVGRVGTRAAAAALTGTSGATLIVGNSFNLPATLGMSVLDADVNYSVHDAASHYRISVAEGGTADDDFSGATFTDVGIADAAGTGWVNVTPVAGAVPLTASARLFLMIHHTLGGSPNTLLAFDAGTPDQYGPSDNPAAYYNGNTTESEYDDGTLGPPATTNVSFDETVAQSGVISPDGQLFNNGNNVGVRMRYAVEGFAVA